MENGVCTIMSSKGQQIAKIPIINGLYHICPKEKAMNTQSKTREVLLAYLHKCIGYMAYPAAKMLISKGMVDGLSLTGPLETQFCEPCVKAKMM